MSYHRIILRTADIVLLEGVSESWASELHSTLKSILVKEKDQKVTIREYCDYRGIPYDETLTDLGLKVEN